jgi:hypothetical protein
MRGSAVLLSITTRTMKYLQKRCTPQKKIGIRWYLVSVQSFNFALDFVTFLKRIGVKYSEANHQVNGVDRQK